MTEYRPISDETERIAEAVLDAAFQVHRALGPGLLESAYEHCLAFEIDRRGLAVDRQVQMPILYEGKRIEAGYRLDIVVGGAVIVEVKAVETLQPIFDAQLMTYLRLSGLRLGFLMNFNVKMFKTGFKRIIL